MKYVTSFVILEVTDERVAICFYLSDGSKQIIDMDRAVAENLLKDMEEMRSN